MDVDSNIEFGCVEEVRKKEVKKGTSSGVVYLPPEYLGREVVCLIKKESVDEDSDVVHRLRRRIKRLEDKLSELEQ